MPEQLTNNQVLLKECIKQEFDENGGFENINAYFEYFAASQMLKPYNLNDDEIQCGIVGKGNDGGCDSIHILLNGNIVTADQIGTLSAPKNSTLELIIVQAKFTTSFGEDVLMKWKTVSSNLMDLNNSISDFDTRYNQAVLDSFQLFRDVVTKTLRSQIKLKISYLYVTIANELHPNVQQQSEELKNIVLSLFPSASIQVDFIDANRLFDLYNRDCDVSEELNLVENAIALTDKDYIGLVNIATYFSFITDDNDKLIQSYFDSNVRDYQGNNSVNTAIANTLENRDIQGDFWWFNNGVTILASNIQLITQKKIIIENPEIVNGQQTSREIYNYFATNPTLKTDEKRNILIRLIKPETEESRDQIIYATNNQTNIPKYSLRVTDAIHYQIELYFKARGLYYDRRKNFYKNQKKKISDIIGVSFLAQCLISIILRKPDFARARPSTLLDDDATYNRLYSESHNLEAYYKAAHLGRTVRNYIKQDTNLSQVEKSDIQFAIIYVLSRKLTNKTSITFDDIRDIDLTQIDNNILNATKEEVHTKYIELGGNSAVAKNPSFTYALDEIINNATNEQMANI